MWNFVTKIIHQKWSIVKVVDKYCGSKKICDCYESGGLPKAWVRVTQFWLSFFFGNYAWCESHVLYNVKVTQILSKVYNVIVMQLLSKWDNLKVIQVLSKWYNVKVMQILSKLYSAKVMPIFSKLYHVKVIQILPKWYYVKVMQILSNW